MANPGEFKGSGLGIGQLYLSLSWISVFFILLTMELLLRDLCRDHISFISSMDKARPWNTQSPNTDCGGCRMHLSHLTLFYVPQFLREAQNLNTSATTPFSKHLRTPRIH